MLSQCEIHEFWIRDYLKPRYPHLVEAFCAALVGYDCIQASNELNSNALRFVVNAACSPRRSLYETGTQLLSDLTVQHEAAREAVLKMFTDPQWHVHSNALLSLNRETPHQLSGSLLRAGLKDKSLRVRIQAAYQVWHLRLIKLIPDLKQQHAIERNPKAQAGIDFYLCLLRDGHALSPLGDNTHYLLWVSTSNSMAGHVVTQGEINTKGIQTLIAEMQR